MNNPREGKIGDGGSRRRGKGGRGLRCWDAKKGGRGAWMKRGEGGKCGETRKEAKEMKGGEEVNGDEQAQKNRRGSI